jgi:hypothetical protein
MLPIFRLILLILGLSGLLNARAILVCIYSPSCYVTIPSHLGLNNSNFSGYNEIYSLMLPIMRLILPVLGHCDFWKANVGPLGTPNQYVLLCLCSLNCYSSIPCNLGLKNLDFSGYDKI